MSKKIIGKSTNEIKILGSSFIALATQISSIDEITSLIDSFKKEYPKADHYPYAYIFNELSKSSDDGEPSGTAGRQFLQLIKNHDLDNCLLIVARYFGGTKLGVGRLTRTFVETANGAILKAKIGHEEIFRRFKLFLDYSSFEVLKKISLKNNIIIEQQNFMEDVEVIVRINKKQNFDWNNLNIKFKTIDEIEKIVTIAED